ncbi:MAG: restriction endonuclease subunit S, partial [Phycisphaerae bacterium]
MGREAQFSAQLLLVPTPKEQKRVADCLTSLDEVIAAQSRKVNALRSHKRVLMQHLFPQEGQALPRLRFPEFRGGPKWSASTLGELSEISSGTTPLRANPEFFEGGTIPWVKTTDLNNSLITHTEECITAKAGARINPIGSILVAMYGGFKQIGRTGMLGMPAATNQAMSVLVVDPNQAVPVYVLTWLNAKVNYWKRIASSSRKDPNVTGSDVAAFPIRLPPIAEQKRIADCLGSFDAAIASGAAALDVIKAHKSGLVQRLFPCPEGV